MRKSRTVGVVLGLVASMFLVAPAAATPRTYPTCNLPESDAEALQILNAVYPNRYVWDDADITVAVQAAPNVDQEYVDAAQDAIAAWADVIEACFDGLITLTDVTDDPTKPQSADIVLHFAPTPVDQPSQAMQSVVRTVVRTSSYGRSSRLGWGARTTPRSICST